jgi:hypothetical protein
VGNKKAATPEGDDWRVIDGRIGASIRRPIASPTRRAALQSELVGRDVDETRGRKGECVHIRP